MARPNVMFVEMGDRVVLSIRGTADIFDALTDVLCEAVPS